jgi:hypothetical protein
MSQKPKLLSEATFTFAKSKSEGCYVTLRNMSQKPKLLSEGSPCASSGSLPYRSTNCSQPYFLQKQKVSLGINPNLPYKASTHINGGVMVKTRYAKQSESEGRSSPAS